MKKIALLFAIITIPLATFAQGSFDSFENEKDVTSVVVTKNMFKLLSKMDLNSNDPEVEDYLKMVDNLETIKIFTTDNPEVAARMSAKVNEYVSSNNELSELMRVKDDGKNIRFYSKQGTVTIFYGVYIATMFFTGANIIILIVCFYIHVITSSRKKDFQCMELCVTETKCFSIK